MATITGLTAERMIEMENATVIDGNIVGNDLVLLTRDGTPINAGNVRGPIGPSGAAFIICTSTTRPTLTVGEEGKAIYETDTDLTRIWTGTRWKLQEKIVCTSIGRPTGLTSADEGVKIYETDTNLEYIWTGTAWLPFAANLATFANAAARTAQIPAPIEGMVSYLLDTDTLEIYAGTAWRKPWNMPWGEEVYATGIPGSGGAPGVDLLSTGARTYVQNRKVKVSWTVHLSSAVTGAAIIELRNSANAALRTWVALFVTNTDVHTFSGITEFTMPGGSATFKVTLVTGGNWAQYGSWLGRTFLPEIQVEDVGPAGPAV